MRAFVIGSVFFVLFVLGIWTVWLQSEVLHLGYEMEGMRSAMDDLERENRSLAVDLASLKTPGSLLAREGILPAKGATVMPPWNVESAHPLPDPAGMRVAKGFGRETVEGSSGGRETR